MVSAVAELLMRTGSALILSRIIGETGLFIAEVAAWGGAVAVLVFSYFHTVRKAELRYTQTIKEAEHAGMAE